MSELDVNPEQVSLGLYRLDDINSCKMFQDEKSTTQLLEFFRQIDNDREGLETSGIYFPPKEENNSVLQDTSHFKRFLNLFLACTYIDNPLPPEIFFINQEENYIGVLYYQPEPVRNGELSGGLSLYLLPEFRKHGLGTKITTDFIESKRGKINNIFFDVLKDNCAGQKSLSKLPGVKTVGHDNICTRYVVNLSNKK